MKDIKKFGVEVYERELKNGSRLFLFKRKGMPIYIRAVFFAGSRYDEIPGTAHFLEHMLVAGTKKFPSKNLIAEYIQKVGGEFGASTDSGLLRLNVEIPEKADIDVGIEVLKECLTNSLFSDKSIENERGAIFSELKSKKSNPKEFIWDVSKRISMQGTSVAQSTLGSEENIKSITKEEILKFYKQNINRGKAIFLVSGDIEIDEISKSLELIDLPNGERVNHDPLLPIIKKEMVEVEQYLGVTQLQVILSTRTNPETFKELCVLRLLNQILFSGRGSRLMTKLRYEKGLVYSVGGSVAESTDWGLMRIQFSCDKSKFDETKNIIFKEFKDLKELGITDAELVNTQSKISKGSIRQMQTSESWINFHESWLVTNTDNPNTIDDYIEVINSLTKDDVNKVINKYLIEENFYTAVCGDI